MTWIRSEPGDIGRALVHLAPAVVVSAMHGLDVYGVSTSTARLLRMDADNLGQWCTIGGFAAPTAEDLAWVRGEA